MSSCSKAEGMSRIVHGLVFRFPLPNSPHAIGNPTVQKPRLFLSVVLWLGTMSAFSSAEEARSRHVMVLCVDGLPAYLFGDRNAPMPNIRRLAAEGVVAEGMVVANPAVTWPNHTSLMTGAWPERHGVLFNGELERPGLGLPIKVNPRKDKLDLVQLPTIYDVLHDQGLTTAAINWPCTRNSTAIHDDFPDVPETFAFTTPASGRQHETIRDCF